MTKRLFALSSVCLVSLLILPSRIPSQAFYGSIVGAVTDQSSAAINGATVTLTNTDTQERHQGQTGADGGYQFLNLVPGVYKIDVEQAGFKRSTRERVEVTVAGVVRADIAMQLGT